MTSVVENDLRTQSARRVATPALSAATLVVLSLALYLIAHVALRLWETPNIGKNEVQEAVAAQAWAWGYHPRNPPLHTWLLMASYAVFGVGLTAHVVLKYLLLGLTYIFGYLCGRRLLTNRVLALAAAASFSLLAPFAWTVHTALTHTLLLAAINLATLWTAIRLSEKRRLADYIVFGAAIGLGFLTKYSYPLFLLPLLAAMLTQRELRGALLNWRFLVSLLVALILFAPHGVWALEARFDFVTFLREKQSTGEPQPYLADVGTGLGQIVIQALGFLAPLVLLFPLYFRGAFKAKPENQPSSWGRALTWLLLFGVGLLVLDVLVLRATAFEVRYLTCAMIAAPLAMFAWLDRRGASEGGLRWLAYSATAIALIVFAGLVGKALLSQRSCNRCYEEMPIASLVRALHAGGFNNGTIIAADYYLGGNMRLAFPHSRIYAANYVVPQSAYAGAGGCALIWNARNAGDAPPPDLRAYISERHLTLPAGGPVYVEAPLRRSARTDRFAYWILPGYDANCRAQ
jgi:4-amino-4-deoxy-L-arabinose transferase-like glycosyltransferase